MNSPAVRVAFVCVQNAGRSQMATALADQERRDRELEGEVEILTGGTNPANHVHDVVVDVMDADGVDLSDRTPREIAQSELATCDHVATMGCSPLELDAANTTAEVRDWALADPDGKNFDEVREIKAEVRQRVRQLFDEIEQEVARHG